MTLDGCFLSCSDSSNASQALEQVLICAAFVCGWPLSGVTSYLRIVCKDWESVRDVSVRWPCGITETNCQMAVLCALNLHECTGQSIAEGCCCGPTHCAGGLAQSLQAGPVCPEQVWHRAHSVCSRVGFKALGGSFPNK